MVDNFMAKIEQYNNSRICITCFLTNEKMSNYATDYKWTQYFWFEVEGLDNRCIQIKKTVLLILVVFKYSRKNLKNMQFMKILKEVNKKQIPKSSKLGSFNKLSNGRYI